LLSDLAEFYNGSISRKELEEMPMPKVLMLMDHAAKIAKNRRGNE